MNVCVIESRVHASKKTPKSHHDANSLDVGRSVGSSEHRFVGSSEHRYFG